mgnify:CR=1 FL=1
MKTNLFETVDELIEFIKEFEEKWADDVLYEDKIIHADYFKLTATLRPKNKNRSIDQESDVYIYREIGSRDTLTDMKIAEQKHSRSDTAWMTRIPIITDERK